MGNDPNNPRFKSVIRWISLSTVKELFTSIDCKLDNHNNHSNTLKAVSMSQNLMPKLLCQTTPELEAIMYSGSSKFVKPAGDLQHWRCSPTYPSLALTHSFGVRWIFSEICEDADIWPQSTFVGHIVPNSGTCQYAECDLMAQSTLLEIVGIKCSAMFRDSKICSIKTDIKQSFPLSLMKQFSRMICNKRCSEQPNGSIQQSNKS